MIFGWKFDFTELWESVKQSWIEEYSDEDVWEEESEESELEDNDDEEWITGDDGIWYPLRFGIYEKDVLAIFDELNP